MHTKTHEPVKHARVEFAGPVGQTWHDAPHASTSESARQVLPQRWKPGLHVKSHVPLEQIGVALVGGVQLTHERPHCVVLVSATQVPPQSWKPGEHCQPQLKPSQVRTEFAGPLGHGVHEVVPHEFTLKLSEHVELQRCVPELQTKSHVTPLHVDVPLGGGTHGEHDVVPQELTELFDTHWPLHACVAVLHEKPQLVPSHVAVLPAGG